MAYYGKSWSKSIPQMGLDIGGISPGEIAVSIVARMVAVRHQRSGKAMMYTERQEHYGKV